MAKTDELRVSRDSRATINSIFQDYFTFINEKRELKVNVVCREEQNRQFVSLFCYLKFYFMCIFCIDAQCVKWAKKSTI